jgi:hypothetical protein
MHDSNQSDFAKLVDDIVRDELMKMGRDYAATVAGVVDAPSGEGCVIRLRGEEEDIPVLDLSGASRTALTAQIHRKLKATFVGPDLFVEPVE